MIRHHLSNSPLSQPSLVTKQQYHHIMKPLTTLLLLFPLQVLSSPTPIQTRQSSSTENGLCTDSCKTLTLIFARGTNEAGNVGSIAGPPFLAALRADLGTDKVTVQGVDYSATVAGYVFSSL
jgi:hypothetical protein